MGHREIARMHTFASAMTPISLRILHFNDVYRVTKQKVEGGTIDVSQWAQMLEDRRSQWPEEGLVLFSGDAFSPSVESSVTRGSHMVCYL
jgi:2',3'-cyclic-nucleotide 2'-phosphodiesterase (5'-nucleotidase family)